MAQDCWLLRERPGLNPNYGFLMFADEELFTAAFLVLGAAAAWTGLIAANLGGDNRFRPNHGPFGEEPCSFFLFETGHTDKNNPENGYNHSDKYYTASGPVEIM